METRDLPMKPSHSNQDAFRVPRSARVGTTSGEKPEVRLRADGASLVQREAAARLLWTTGIIGFFLIQAVLWVVAITLTHRDPSHAVLAGYDARALSWDEHRARLRASEALGWQPQLSTWASDDPLGRQVLQVELKDRDQQPISGAEIEVAAFHRARAAERQVLTLEELQPGVYESRFAPRQSGGWQFDLTAARDSEHFAVSLRQFVNVGRK